MLKYWLLKKKKSKKYHKANNYISLTHLLFVQPVQTLFIVQFQSYACVYIYIYTYTYTYKYVYIHIHVYIYIHIKCISPSDPETRSLGPILAYLRSFKSVFQSVCVFSLSFLWSLVLPSLCTLPTQPQRSMKGLNITRLKGEKFFLLTMAGSDGRWKRRRRRRRREWGVFTVAVIVQLQDPGSSYNHICCH